MEHDVNSLELLKSLLLMSLKELGFLEGFFFPPTTGAIVANASFESTCKSMVFLPLQETVV
jgi:hypothetical protein